MLRRVAVRSVSRRGYVVEGRLGVGRGLGEGRLKAGEGWRGETRQKRQKKARNLILFLTFLTLF